MKEPQVQTAIRLPESLLKRIDKIALSMSEPGRHCTRAEALRIAVTHGVDKLETGKKKTR